MEEVESGSKPKSPEKPSNKEPKSPQPKDSASEPEKKKKRKGKKQDGKKLGRKKMKREEGAPKLPLTGYVRYMNKRRDELRIEFPDKTAIEHTKIIAEEWNALSEELKKPFLHAAEVDKERYVQEVTEFNRSKSERAKADDHPEATTTQPAATVPRTSSSSSSTLPTEKTPSQTNGTANKELPPAAVIPYPVVIPKQFRRNGDHGIPIFTDEFLDHNKSVDLELRMLRKSNVDYEQQNSVLEKHIENMRFGVEKMNSDNAVLVEKNRLLEAYLDRLKAKLVQSFAALSIPSQPHGATDENFDKYMAELHAMATSNTHGPACLNKAKDIARKLDLQIQL